MTTSHIELSGIGKRYPVKKENYIFKDFWALKDISLSVGKGQVFGIIGRNGAGKTTLLNIIARTLSPTEGNISLSGKTMGLFNLGVGFQDELTGKENIFLNGAILGASRKELEEKLNSIVEFSELGDFIEMPLGSYSQGMRLRLGFSIIASLDFETLVIDEVLAVGDSLFQSKCYERLMDFRRTGKTLIITSQDMGIIERLCDQVLLLDHGSMLFKGAPLETINRYRALLNTERFFVGPSHNDNLVEDTKKWSEDIQDWGKKLGTKEVVIESVEFINRFGFRVSRIKSGKPLRIKVIFTAKNRVVRPHFGIAIFREDGVYCYGPNTGFDRYDILELKPGRGYFELDYSGILLAPGSYRVSVAIWDKNEKLAFDYHNGFYKLEISGFDNADNELLNMPHRISAINHSSHPADGAIVELRDASDREKNIFVTNQPLRLTIFPGFNHMKNKSLVLWAGIYRSDGIYCQGITADLKKDKNLTVFFPKISLLPGSYNISIRVLDSSRQKTLTRHDSISSFRMVFNKQDHGTLFMEHEWKTGGF